MMDNILLFQIELACELKKPLFLHERDAHDDLLAILSRHKDSLPPVFLHSFSGNCKQAKEYIDMGIYLGITGNFFDLLHFISGDFFI